MADNLNRDSDGQIIFNCIAVLPCTGCEGVNKCLLEIYLYLKSCACEDPFIWEQPDGTLHMLDHLRCDGYHAFCSNVSSWTLATGMYLLSMSHLSCLFGEQALCLLAMWSMIKGQT